MSRQKEMGFATVLGSNLSPPLAGERYVDTGDKM